MPAKLTRKDDELALDLSNCRGQEFHDVKAKIRDITGRKFDWDRKLWLLPAEPEVAERVMHAIQPTMDSDLQEWVKAARTKAAEELTTPLPDDAELAIEWAKSRAPHQPEFIRVGSETYPFNGLMKHQRPVVDRGAAFRKILLADDMGLGKTGTTISAVEEWRLRNRDKNGDKPSGPKLVVCPNSVKGTWVRELKMWLGLDDTQIVAIDEASPAKRHELLADAVARDAWVIVNWEQIRRQKKKRKLKNGGTKTEWHMKEPLFEKTEWMVVIADEIHRAKNRKSQQTQGLFQCRADDGVMLGLSGTPLMNSPDELWAMLHWLWPKEYTSYWRFYEEYVDYYEGYFGKVITGVKNPDALRFELKDRLIRRTQGQVLDLPGKGRIRVPLELNKKQKKLYKEAEKKMWLEVEQAVKEGDKSAEKFAAAAVEGNLLQIKNGATRTTRLRQIIETPANLGGEDDSAVLDAAVDHILDSGDEQWVVFCEFVPSVECLVERLKKKKIEAVAYTGKVDSQERSRIEDRYQAGNIQVVVGTIDAMYQGITLTAGNRQFWCSRDWTPAKNEQGEDRQNRIGQQRRVMVFIAQPDGTVAVDKVEPTNRLKERIVGSVVPRDAIKEE